MSVTARAVPASERAWRSFPRPRLSAYAWGAIAVTAAFIAFTCWWLAHDRSVPIYDVGDQLETVLTYRSMLAAGNLLGPFTYTNVYPILGHVVGALGAFVGGVNVSSPVIAENVVFVPLLALGCYQTGRLLFGPLAGLLAVVFVFGSPLLTSLFHVFLLDAPLAAMVALSMWLVLASEDFTRRDVSAWAGLAVGLGLNVKVQFVLFLIGLTIVVLLHGGRRSWPGFGIFAVVALIVGTPWYLVHFSELGMMVELASSGPGTPPGNIPPTFTVANLEWYFWDILNSQLLAPLFCIALVGGVWTLVTVVRERGRNAARLEFLLGGFLAWFAITFPDSHHDIRYGLSLLAFLSVVATGWIAFLPRAGRYLAIAILLLAVAANTLGTAFGVGGEAKLALASKLSGHEQLPDRIVLYTTTGFLASAPTRDGDMPGLLRALARQGVRTVTWGQSQSSDPDFSFEGLVPLSHIAGLTPVLTEGPEFSTEESVVTLVHKPLSAGMPPTCTRLSDGTGVWMFRYDRALGRLALYCPTRRVRFYAPGAKV
jgi:4-amino-4-deoxy-L-arabinose transferase-like glycosyltransferase